MNNQISTLPAGVFDRLTKIFTLWVKGFAAFLGPQLAPPHALPSPIALGAPLGLPPGK